MNAPNTVIAAVISLATPQNSPWTSKYQLYETNLSPRSWTQLCSQSCSTVCPQRKPKRWNMECGCMLLETVADFRVSGTVVLQLPSSSRARLQVSAYLCIYLSVCLPACLSIYLSPICSSVCLSTHLPSIYSSIHPSIYLSISLSTYIHTCTRRDMDRNRYKYEIKANINM